MNWTTLQQTIQAWAAAQTGLTTFWANQNDPKPLYPFCMLNVIAESQLGTDEIRYGDPDVNGKLPASANGNRLFTVSCQIHTTSQTPATSGRNYTSKLRGSLKLDSVRETFKAAGLAVVRAIGMQSIDRVVEGTWVSINLIDINFAAAQVLADTPLDYIQTVNATGTFPPNAVTITGPWGVGV